jgi:hypothetical protein
MGVITAPPPTPVMPTSMPSADSEEKHEPASDIDTLAVDSVKTLDPDRPIREADSARTSQIRRF